MIKMLEQTCEACGKVTDGNHEGEMGIVVCEKCCTRLGEDATTKVIVDALCRKGFIDEDGKPTDLAFALMEPS
jgi:hypothetical protein